MSDCVVEADLLGPAAVRSAEMEALCRPHGRMKTARVRRVISGSSVVRDRGMLGTIRDGFLPGSFFAQPVVSVARALIGTALLVAGVGGLIVETEAYARDDPASHSFRGPTPRNAAMFGPPGRAYIYRSYGIHWCFNIVSGVEPGGAVLIRAIEPRHGLDLMRTRRGVEDARRLCSGPGRLCQALGLTIDQNGLALDEPLFGLSPRDEVPEIAAGPRIGLTRAAEVPWRFGLAGSRFLSRPFPKPGSARSAAI